MEISNGILFGAIALVVVILILFEYRVRNPDVLLLYETQGKINLRTGRFYARHFSLALSRATHPIQLTIETTAKGNLEVRVKLIGSIAPSLEHIQALVLTGGWNQDAVAHAAEDVQIMLQGLVKEYTEQCEIHALTTTGLSKYLSESSASIEEKFGVKLISLAVQNLEPVDPEIGEALRQQEQARLLEQTERLSHEARMAAAKAKILADEEISRMEHDLELKKAALKLTLLEREAALTHQSLDDELKRNRMRLAFEKEELEVLKNSPELLMLTPQAARLAEASQNLKNARTIVSFTPQELAQGSELMRFFQNLLQKTLEENKADEEN